METKKSENRKIIDEYEREYKLDKPREVKPFNYEAHVLAPKEYINKSMLIQEINNEFEICEIVKPFGNGAHVDIPKEHIGKLVRLKVVEK